MARTLHRLLPIVACGLLAVTAGCGSSGDDASTPAVDAATTVADATPTSGPTGGIGGIGDAVEVMAAAPGRADAAACDVNHRTLETAAETYLLMVGSPATSQQDLVDEQMITEVAPGFDVDADGLIVAAPGGPCA